MHSIQKFDSLCSPFHRQQLTIQSVPWKRYNQSRSTPVPPSGNLVAARASWQEIGGEGDARRGRWTRLPPSGELAVGGSQWAPLPLGKLLTTTEIVTAIEQGTTVEKTRRDWTGKRHRENSPWLNRNRLRDNSSLNREENKTPSNLINIITIFQFLRCPF
jgi:hypothetical protein